MQQQSGRMEASHGVSFKTDLSNVGTRRSASGIFGVSGGQNILQEERQLINKVFAIVDRDASGFVDMAELKEMFSMFGVESSYLQSAMAKLMSNVDKDFDGTISPQEFYQLLSQKFDKNDKMEDIQPVFKRMDKNNDGELDLEELHDVAQMLGDTMDKKDIKDMIKTFNQDYQEKYSEWQLAKKKNPSLKPPPEPKTLSLQDFFAVMQEEL
uniref:EF-hand domain-containing protein n=1 Tax=Strombidinopsis acuminata TaxID=141414 RepID=A0A7S3RC60_9SPIT|mmetsp:Transcript_56380/g.145143  ORF Transcript_56380/g.145143 Transcript_56380/m.145143 type:complete len:211 (+) Transcript_56380:90-722(+)